MFKEPLHPFPHTALYIFSLTTPPPSERTHFMCNPKVIHNEEKSKINFLHKICIWKSFWTDS